MAKKLLLPEHVKDAAVRRYNGAHRDWLVRSGDWPLAFSLGAPTEAEVIADLPAVQIWAQAWRQWAGPGAVEFEPRKWARLGSQDLPARLVLSNPGEVAALCGQDKRWARAVARREVLLGVWPDLGINLRLGRYFDVLADYADTDFDRLVAVVQWLEANADSNLYIRQLPVIGVDTKWLEKRQSLVAELLCLVTGSEKAGDFFDVTGLRRLPHRLRVIVLCPELRRSVGGLRDFEAPIEDVVQLGLTPKRVLVVENHACATALGDMPGCVVFAGLGKAVGVLGRVGWLQDVPALYWGDIDTHGLVILNSARAALPGLQSVLMDVATLFEFKELAVHEAIQAVESGLEHLTTEETELLEGLRSGRWGLQPRIEQERLPWMVVEAALLAAGLIGGKTICDALCEGVADR
ncbi:DUF3322 domain-containing protein [Ideonella sp. B508-1]|uniref:DUF3322 domain-containing protein n=1 Tax=Ideonella sp. B508-1 TaxID=137716 RepID=UPI0003B3DF53|nr:DUF3322 domain-containing protein [Ideonella sp. B508-1]